MTTERKTLMFNIVATAILALTVTTSRADNGAEQPRECSLKTLRGLYLFSATGFNIVGGVAQPKAIVEYIRFNGDGTPSVPAATVSNNGVISRSQEGLGTYSLEPSCTGALVFGPPGPTFDLFASPLGRTVAMIQTGGFVPGVLEGQLEFLSY
jgi:hypothetical protein